MNEQIKELIDNKLTLREYNALNIATQSIYFHDNSDYLKALYDVVIELLGEEAPEYIDEDFIDKLVHQLNPDWT